MSTEQYNKLLQIMDELSINDDDGPHETCEALEPLPKYVFGGLLYELSTILNSNIFRNGQLKGARGYNRSYQINDLEKFIWLLCEKISLFPFTVNVAQHNEYILSDLVEAIEKCRPAIRSRFGKRAESQMTALKGKIETWLENWQESSPKSFFTKLQLSNDITEIFKEHIPNVPE